MTKKTIFDYQAQVGLTKHMGGLEATEKLIHHSDIKSEHEVLEVGCGVGQTTVLLVKRIGCRVVAVDISEAMIEYAQKYAKKEGVSDKIEFRQGDISELPSEDERFDALFCESVTVLAPDHRKAIQEYTRVLKPGGLVGINEVLYLKDSPPDEIIDWIAHDASGGGHTRHMDSWKALLEEAGLQLDFFEVHPPDIRNELSGLIKRYGCGHFLKVMMQILWTYITDPEYRTFVRELQRGGVVPENLTEYVGYGLFVARKSL